jgi:hypothetical protein
VEGTSRALKLHRLLSKEEIAAGEIMVLIPITLI